MGKALVVVFAVALLVYAVFDLIATPRHRVQALPKWLWLVVVVLVPFIGPIAWLLLGSQREGPAPRGPGQAPRWPRGPLGPDDDPDYLGKL